VTAYELPGDQAAASVTFRRLAAFLAAVVVGLVRLVVPHLFTIAGLACFAAAAFTISPAAGLVAAGVGLFVFEWRISQTRGYRR
jgi:hypothetical protein